MKKYIGIDAHCKYCDIAVVDEKGRLLSHRSVKTGAETLIRAVKEVTGARAVVVEESTLIEKGVKSSFLILFYTYDIVRTRGGQVYALDIINKLLLLLPSNPPAESFNKQPHTSAHPSSLWLGVFVVDFLLPIRAIRFFS